MNIYYNILKQHFFVSFYQNNSETILIIVLKTGDFSMKKYVFFSFFP